MTLTEDVVAAITAANNNGLICLVLVLPVHPNALLDVDNIEDLLAHQASVAARAQTRELVANLQAEA